MSSEFKLDVVSHDFEESGLSSLKGRSGIGRVSRGKRAALDDSVSLQIDGDEKREHGPGRKSGPLLSGTAYCISFLQHDIAE
uniref:Uncharacterized protein n=1 Tax=Fagus sylvatica TaxID=28930 RepID=A0A2N9I5T4_FAGSY